MFGKVCLRAQMADFDTGDVHASRSWKTAGHRVMQLVQAVRKFPMSETFLTTEKDLNIFR